MVKEITPLLSIINQLILATIIFAASKKKRHNILLGILILLPLFPNLFNYLTFSGKIINFKYFTYFAALSNSWYAPILYFFVQSVLGKPYKFHIKHSLHAIPFLYSIFYCILFSLKSPLEQQEYLTALSHGVFGTDLKISNTIQTIQIIGYISYLLITWKREIKNLSQYYSNENNVRLQWIRFFLWAHFFMMIPLVIIVVFPFTEGFEIILPFLTLILFCYVIYYSIRIAPNLQITYAYTEEPRKELNSKPCLPEDSQKTLLAKLKNQLENKKIYLQKDLTLKDLANVLEVQPYVLSYTINNNLNQNFFDLINSYRVEEAKIQLCSPGSLHLTIDGIGFNCGFGSKVSFNRAFKKYTGQTPSEYKQSQS